MPRIIQIIADPKRYVLSKLLQTPSAMYYPNYCKALMLCIIQITVKHSRYVLAKLL